VFSQTSPKIVLFGRDVDGGVGITAAREVDALRGVALVGMARICPRHMVFTGRGRRLRAMMAGSRVSFGAFRPGTIHGVDVARITERGTERGTIHGADVAGGY
jgi:hypothetical protein